MTVDFDTSTQAPMAGLDTTNSANITPTGPLPGIIAVLHGDRALTNPIATWRGSSIGSPDYDKGGTEVHPYVWIIPAAGLTSGTFVASWDNSARAGIGLIALKGANPNGFIRGSVPTANGSSTSPSVTVVGVIEGDLVVDVVMAENNNAATEGSGQTEIWDFQTNDTFLNRGYASYEAATGSVVMDWTIDASQNWAQLGFACKASIGGSQVIMVMSKMQDFYDQLKKGLIPSWDLQRRYKEVFI